MGALPLSLLSANDRAHAPSMALAEAIAEVHRARAPLAVAQVLCTQARALVPCGRVDVLLRPRNEANVPHVMEGEAPAVMALEPWWEWLRQHPHPVPLEPLSLPPGAQTPGPGPHGWLALPVMAPHQPAAGVVVLTHHAEHSFDDRDVARLGQLVLAGGLALAYLDQPPQAAAAPSSPEPLSERFQVALDAAHLAVWETNLATGQVFRSDNHDQLYGYPERLPEWTHEMFLASLHPEDRPSVDAQVAGIFSGEVGDYTSTFRTRWPDGSWHWLNSRARVLRDEEGRPVVVRGAILDITTLKETERALREAVRVRDDFLSLASHELKTPLTGLSLQLQSLRRLAATESELPLSAPKVQSRLESTERILRRLGALVDNLLDVSRIQNGKLDFHFAPGDLAMLVSEVVARLEEQARQAGVTLTSHIEAPLEGSFDRLRLEQVLVNLISNALRYGAGSPVEVCLARTAGGARLVVRDGGPGIPEADRERIFGRFEQMASTARAGGLGLGLFIVKQIVEGHRGHVHVESGPEGQGAAFVVELPL